MGLPSAHERPPDASRTTETSRRSLGDAPAADAGLLADKPARDRNPRRGTWRNMALIGLHVLDRLYPRQGEPD